MQLKSVCPFDCPDTCGLLVTVENGRAVRVCADPEHPVTAGLICSKMQHYERTVHSGNRLLAPMLRTGKKGTGSFRSVSWDEAAGYICSRWKQIIADYGAEAVLPYSYAGTMGMVQRNCGHAFFHKMGASRLTRTICTPAKEAGWKAVMGNTPAPEPSARAASDLVILWGQNAAVTSIHTMRDALQARKNGGRIWAIDTYQTPTCQRADQSFIIKPGSDGALALAMLHVIVTEGLYDRQFTENCISGFEEFCSKTLPDCTPEAMSHICGVEADRIRRMAREYAQTKAAWIQIGGGLSRYGNGAMNCRCIILLPAATGAWQYQGGGVFCGTSTSAAFPVHLITREDFISKQTRVINMNQLGAALSCQAANPVKGLYVYHSNPASIAPDQNAVLEGLAREDLFTVVHERFMTDTALYADLLLPATTSLEHDDIYRSYGSYHAQRCKALIPAAGESRSNWDTFCLLADGMGWDEPFFRQSAEDLIQQLLAGENSWRNATVSELLGKGMPVLLTPPSVPPGSWLTASGKIMFHNPAEPEPLPRLMPTHAMSDGFGLRLQAATTPHALNSSFFEREELRSRQSCMSLMMNPADAAERNLEHRQQVVAFNHLGSVQFSLDVTELVPAGTVVTEGVWWSQFVPGGRGVNALTSQRLTDQAEGSTLYDVAVEVKPL